MTNSKTTNDQKMQVGIDSFATALTNDATTIELIGTRVAPILRAAEKNSP